VSIAQRINDLRWALNVMHARAYRRTLIFSQRKAFDDALRPSLEESHASVVGYPDAFYHVSIDDLCRAIVASKLMRKDGA
jgi:hypothetical protein